MIKRTLLQVSALALGLTLSAFANADSGGPMHGKNKFMSFFDTNQDGSVTLEEFKDASANRFKRMDTNGDGKISADEFESYVSERRAEHKKMRYAAMDTNKDGNVSKEEYLQARRAHAEHKFMRMDKNGDGVLSPDEFASCKGKMKGHYKSRIFSRLDANQDGVVSQEESLNGWTGWFKRLDANGDNVVTTDEIAQARKNRQGQ